jgi:bacillithiol system protein YtxJ
VIRDLDHDDTVDRAAADEVALIYKHSSRCASAVPAESEVNRFAQAHPGVPVYRMDVVQGRALARAIAARFGVRHESPQVILLRRGRVVWAGSHGEIDADALDALLRAPAGT